MTIEEALEQMGVDTRILAAPVEIDARLGSQVEFKVSWHSRTDLGGDFWIVHDGWRDDEIVATMWLRDGEQKELMPLALDRHWVARACRWPQVHRSYRWLW